MAKAKPREPESLPTPSVAIRWVLPPVQGPAYQHAYVIGQPRTLCLGYLVEGSVYPPATDVPKCIECVAACKRLDDANRDA